LVPGFRAVGRVQAVAGGRHRHEEAAAAYSAALAMRVYLPDVPQALATQLRFLKRNEDAARAAGLAAAQNAKSAALLTEVDAASISASRKTALRAQIAALQEKVKAMGKQVAAAMEQKAIAQARAIAQSAQNSNSLVVVSQIDCGDDRQALQSAVKVIRDTLPRVAVMLFAVDEAGKAMMHASVPDAAITKGLKAGAWLREAASAMGGKGGGKDDNAQGGAPNGQNVRDAMRAAEQVALKALM
jgi:alanyl-tRNA synthetase